MCSVFKLSPFFIYTPNAAHPPTVLSQFILLFPFVSQHWIFFLATVLLCSHRWRSNPLHGCDPLPCPSTWSQLSRPAPSPLPRRALHPTVAPGGSQGSLTPPFWGSKWVEPRLYSSTVCPPLASLECGNCTPVHLRPCLREIKTALSNPPPPIYSPPGL